MAATCAAIDAAISASLARIDKFLAFHLLLNQFHLPFDEKGNPEEKRSLAISRPDDYDAQFDAKDPVKLRERGTTKFYRNTKMCSSPITTTVAMAA